MNKGQNYLVPKPQPREVWVKLCRLVRLLQGGEALQVDQTGAGWPRVPFSALEPAHCCRAISQQPRQQQGRPSGRRQRCALRTTGHNPSPADVPFNALRPLPYRVSHLRPLHPPPSLASAARPVAAWIRARPLPRPFATPRPARCPAARCAAPSHTLGRPSPGKGPGHRARQRQTGQALHVGRRFPRWRAAGAFQVHSRCTAGAAGPEIGKNAKRVHRVPAVAHENAIAGTRWVPWESVSKKTQWQCTGGHHSFPPCTAVTS